MRTEEGALCRLVFAVYLPPLFRGSSGRLSGCAACLLTPFMLCCGCGNVTVVKAYGVRTYVRTLCFFVVFVCRVLLLLLLYRYLLLNLVCWGAGHVKVRCERRRSKFRAPHFLSCLCFACITRQFFFFAVLRRCLAEKCVTSLYATFSRNFTSALIGTRLCCAGVDSVKRRFVHHNPSPPVCMHASSQVFFFVGMPYKYY